MFTTRKTMHGMDALCCVALCYGVNTAWIILPSSTTSIFGEERHFTFSHCRSSYTLCNYYINFLSPANFRPNSYRPVFSKVLWDRQKYFHRKLTYTLLTFTISKLKENPGVWMTLAVWRIVV